MARFVVASLRDDALLQCRLRKIFSFASFVPTLVLVHLHIHTELLPAPYPLPRYKIGRFHISAFKVTSFPGAAADKLFEQNLLGSCDASQNLGGSTNASRNPLLNIPTFQWYPACASASGND